MFRNSHAVIKNNRPISDYNMLCQLDKAKGLDCGNTYLNEKAAVNFLQFIASVEMDNTKEMLERANFFSFMMDGSTDLSGDEQEVIYISPSFYQRASC